MEENQELAIPRGPWVLRSHAQREFDLAPSDLDSILPVSVEENPHGNPWPMTKYNWQDVEALYQRLRPTFGPDERAEADGEPIDRDSAMFQFRLKDCQMNRIKPTDIVNGIKVYNHKDVRDLADRIDHAIANPTGNRRPANYVPPDGFNRFDGLNNDDAEFWFNRLMH
ncbi:hypothetical protein NM688_g6961 [Phlebia brevispora]|uniref:Uncharacterized protein n=1 Tax=Phlebia brevispora TaxID=194682 RepID=A0ACC1SAJ7_9APHY|nr:hypothetical protein NM688_g6961 [Phlebia brevispora]